MAVFTEVSEQQADQLMQQLHLGELVSLQGISGGIENTNYFASTASGDYVLTLFERLNHAQLPFYLQLMKHLAGQGIKVPMPQADPHGEILFTLCDKPAAVVERLQGQSELNPSAAHCHAVGDMPSTGVHSPACQSTHIAVTPASSSCRMTMSMKGSV
jgi:homoserine kinase type II